jgi:hypothetical protein
MTEQEFQNKCTRFVENNVYVNETSLVEAALSKEFFTHDDLDNIYTQDPITDEDYENYEKEILEWLHVDDRLAKELEKEKECILRNEYGTWWGRCTSGQAIMMDDVIRKIVKSFD